MPSSRQPGAIVREEADGHRGDQILPQGIAAMVREEIMGILPRLHEVVAFAVRRELSPIEALVQKVAAAQERLPDPNPKLHDSKVLRCSVNEMKETKQNMVSEEADVYSEDLRAEQLRENERQAAEVIVRIESDIRRIMREELCAHISANPPVNMDRESSEPARRSPRIPSRRSPSPPASLHGPTSPPPEVAKEEVVRSPPSPLVSPPAPATQETPGQEPQECSPEDFDRHAPKPHEFMAMKTTEMKNFVGDAFQDPDGQAAAEFEAHFADALDDPRLLEAALFKLAPKNRCLRALQPCVHWLLTLVEPERSGCINSLVHHHKFEMSCNFVITLNAVFAGYMADWEIKHIGGDPSLFINGTELAFMSVYLLELILKISVHRLFFFCNDEWTWNNFDFLLVMLSLYEQVMAVAGIGTGGSITFMRIFRLLKLSKILRLFRALKFLQELKLMMAAIARTMSALFWAMVMVTFFFFVFGLVMLQGLTGYLAEAGNNVEPRVEAEIMEKFGSMSATMLTLYMVTTGGDDWGNAYNTIVHAGDMYSLFFLFYIAFFVFAVMNILTGMIVENVSGLAAQDEEAAVLSYRRERQEVVENARLLFNKLDQDGTGMLDEQEFHKAMQSDAMHALMTAMDLDVQDGRMFFNTLKMASGSDSVNVNGFIDGCMRMKGTATAIDMQCALTEIRAIHDKIGAMNTSDLGKESV